MTGSLDWSRCSCSSTINPATPTPGAGHFRFRSAATTDDRRETRDKAFQSTFSKPFDTINEVGNKPSVAGTAESLIYNHSHPAGSGSGSGWRGPRKNTIPGAVYSWATGLFLCLIFCWLVFCFFSGFVLLPGRWQIIWHFNLRVPRSRARLMMREGEKSTGSRIQGGAPHKSPG